MDARSAPEGICQAHLTDQLPNFEGQLGPAGSSSRLPAPEGAESSTMPSYDRLGPHDCHRIKNSRREPIQQYKDKPIKRFHGGALGCAATQNVQLVRSAITSPSSELLDRKRSRRIHLSRLRSSSTQRSSRDSGAQTKRMEFAVGTGGSFTPRPVSPAEEDRVPSTVCGGNPFRKEGRFGQNKRR
jgi:hypothetical protein